MKGAYLEVVADTAGSVGVLLAGGLVMWTGDAIWDTLVALAIGGYIAVRAVILGREVLAVLGQHAPVGVDVGQVHADLVALDGVVDVHDLHLWTLTSGMHVATVHVTVVSPATARTVLGSARALLKDGHGIPHATVQVETRDDAQGCADTDW